MNSAAGERREIEYAVHAGVSLKGHFYAPRGPGKFPVVIAVHGGGWRLANLDNYRTLGPWLAGHGYGVLAVTHRLSKPAEKVYPEAVQDVRAAVQFVKAMAPELKADPERIALMGDSSGGHLAALVALAGEHALFREGNAADPHGRVSTAVKACVPIYAVLDLARQWRHDQISRPRDQIVEKFLGVSLLDSEPDMAAEAFGRDEAGGEFAGVQADVHLGIKSVQKADDLHVQRVVGHRGGPIFGHDVVDAHKARIGGNNLEAQQRLRENLLLRKSAQNLIQIPDRDFACRRFLRLTAMLAGAA